MPDPDLEITTGGGGEGGGAVIQAIRKRGALSQKIFSALRASVWSKNKGGPGPLPWVRHLDIKVDSGALVAYDGLVDYDKEND